MRTETISSTAEIVRGYLTKNFKIPGIGDEVDIFSAGYVNSLFAIELMTFLEKAFTIKVTMEDLDMENFKSIQNITHFVDKKKEKANG